MKTNRLLEASHCGLVIIDIQEAFEKSISALSDVVESASKLARGFGLLGLPVVFTEQYPKGLGPTVADLREHLSGAVFVEKHHFSACRDVSAILKAKDVKQVLLCGIETHVCVNQTAHDLLADGFEVHVVEDAVDSRHEFDRKTALRKMYGSGAIPSTVEMALFELLNDSKHAKFKEIQALIK
ncbi:MAG: isochorismatase family protein [Pyrinomonadaceae bacterium]